MAAPLGVTLGKTAGSLKSTIVDRVETLELPLAHIIPEGISNLILPIAVFVYMVIIDWRLALAAFVGVPIGILAYAIVMKTFSGKYEEQVQASNHANSMIVEYVEGIEVIKMFGRSGNSYEKFTAAITNLKDFILEWFSSTNKFMYFADAVMASTLLGILPVGIILFIRGAITPAEFVMCIILSMGIIEPLTWFSTMVNHYKEIEYAIKDAGELLNLPELENATEAVE
jgi:ATP-binding cassette subfamily B protein